MKALLIYGLMIFIIPLAFFSPFAGLISYLAVAYLRPHQWAYIPDTRISMFVAMATLLGYLLFEVTRRFPRIIPNALLVLLWLQLLISTFASFNPTESRPKMIEVTKVFVISLLMTALADSGKRVRQLYLGTAVILGALAVRSFARAIYGGAENRSYGPGGMFEDNNDYALLLVMALPIIYYAAKAESTRLWRWGLYFCALATFFTVFVTRSRGGFVGLCVVMFMLAIRTKYKVTGAIFAPLAILLVLAFAPDVITERFRTIREDGREDRSAQQRLRAWNVCFEIMRDHPFTGVGFRNLMAVYGNYEDEADARVAHNSFLQMGAEGGIPAMLLLVGLIALSYFRLWRTRTILRARAPDSPLIYYSHGLQIALIGYCVSGFFVSRQDLELLYEIVALATTMRMLAHQAEQLAQNEIIVESNRVTPPPFGAAPVNA
ncbi:MAG: putative O-glycosylation ligase, exosortase A system-associated [Acidobacteria bacterium]|nr:putative O-glycosylation ligase, exosortase A system-associated [Acidobacteriota bacterium]